MLGTEEAISKIKSKLLRQPRLLQAYQVALITFLLLKLLLKCLTEIILNFQSFSQVLPIHQILLKSKAQVR
jgi:hypothetical protein